MDFWRSIWPGLRVIIYFACCLYHRAKVADLEHAVAILCTPDNEDVAWFDVPVNKGPLMDRRDT